MAGDPEMFPDSTHIEMYLGGARHHHNEGGSDVCKIIETIFTTPLADCIVQVYTLEHR